jgi:hypothetical protein
LPVANSYLIIPGIFICPHIEIEQIIGQVMSRARIVTPGWIRGHM